ncbi:sigma-70 family RNA polymerase sigma factor [Streptomyces sp. ADI93-02]|uniref:sigma-70 family RNA polymerase sigma factor n=1 Tax=Streptomyces sp. ADI93-02 TaxID=1522757 RepID=UPI000F55330A|nr:sigma-70 family RNA polymerase sigma factor [Streptomyces sp. ADI93-02]
MGWTAMGGSATEPSRGAQLVQVGYDEHLSGLFHYVRRLLAGDDHKAEDVVQETMLRCWSRFGTGDVEFLRPWLFVVARNLVIDGRRREQARPQVLASEGWPDQSLDLPDEFEAVLTSMVVRDAVGLLTEPHRQVLHSRYVLGRSITESARDLEIPVGTVKSRLHHARCSLRSILEEQGVI